MTEKRLADYPTCERCGRKVLNGWPRHNRVHYDHGRLSFRVVHEYEGCDSGCCGHRALLFEDGEPVDEDYWEFGHPMDVPDEEYVARMVGELKQRIDIDLSDVPIDLLHCEIRSWEHA